MMRTLLWILALGSLMTGSAFADKPMRFDAKLFGFNAAGAPIATNAQGHASVVVIDGGTALKFKVNVAGIDNLLMAHIHIAPAPVELTGPAGPIAFWFVGGPPPGSVNTETVNGTLAEGYIVTNGDLNSWNPSDPDDGTIAGLITAISEGRASVVVHTDDLDPNTPTGVAGDSRAGELRGTLQ
jgi:hypothetical protein